MRDMICEVTRREFLRKATVVAAAAAGSFRAENAQGVVVGNRAEKIGTLIDTNVWLSRWPFRRLPLDVTPALVAKLRNQGVTETWAGSFDGMLHKDLASVNLRLAQECRQHVRGLLVPFGSVNPRLPDWEEELRRCHEDHQMRGIRLHPNYHGYKLDDPVCGKLLDLARERGLIVQIAMSMEDERMQHPLLQVPNVDALPLLDALKTRPGLRIVLLNWFRAVKGELLARLASAGQVFFDIATVEGVGGVGNLLKQVPPQRVLFGSYAPFFYFESAQLKLKESMLSEDDLRGIKAGNASRLLARTVSR